MPIKTVLAIAAATVWAMAPTANAAAANPSAHHLSAPRDCPLVDLPYSVDSPLIDILLDGPATAALRSDAGFAAFLDKAPPMLTGTTAPSFAAIVTPRTLTGWARIPAEVLPALDARLRAVPVTAQARRLRCARYDDDPPQFDLPKGKPAVLVFEKINGFRDGPSVDAAHAALAAMGQRHGWAVVFTDRGGVMTADQLGKFRVVVWNNVSGDVLTTAQRAAFRAYIEQGGGYAGIHGSAGDPAAFWPWYLDEVVGARFKGHPMTPQFQTAKVALSDWGRSIAPTVPGEWSMKDEWYSFTANPRASGAKVVAALDETTYDPGAELAMGGDHPIAWTRAPGAGRSFYTAIGHLPETYADPQALALLESGIVWAGRLDE